MTRRTQKTDRRPFATIVTAMQRAGVSQEVREAITGHAKVGVHARTYSQGDLPLNTLATAIDAVVFDFVHPTWADNAGYRYARRTRRAYAGNVEVA